MIQRTKFNERVRVHKYGYRRNPLIERGFDIIKHIDGSTKTEIIGSYMPLRKDEALSSAERKVMNLVNTLNGEEFVPMNDDAGDHMLYEISDTSQDFEANKGHTPHYILRALQETGVSIPNAIIAFSDPAADQIFRDRLAMYCEAVSAPKLKRNPSLYGSAPRKAGKTQPDTTAHAQHL